MATKKVKAVKPAEKRPVGRPSKWKDEYCDLAFKFCLLGATDKQLAGYFDVNEDTIHEWKISHPEFSESIYNGRDKADAEIANSLYHRAKGYKAKEVDIRVVGGTIVETDVVKEYPPDTAAASLWLRNRQGARWRDKTEVDHTGTLSIDKMPDDVLEDRMKELFARMALK